MICVHVQEQIPAYITGDISAPERELISLHLSTCLACSLWLEEVGELASIWHHPTHPLPSPSFVSSVMQGIGVVEASQRVLPSTATLRRKKSWTKTTLVHYGIAASCAVLLLQFGVFQGFSMNAELVNGMFSAKVQGLMAYASQLFY